MILDRNPWRPNPQVFQWRRFPKKNIRDFLVGGWTNPSEEYATVKLDHFPQFSGWKLKKIFELPPPRFSGMWEMSINFLIPLTQSVSNHLILHKVRGKQVHSSKKVSAHCSLHSSPPKKKVEKTTSCYPTYILINSLWLGMLVVCRSYLFEILSSIFFESPISSHWTNGVLMPCGKTFFFFGHRSIVLPEMDGALQLFPPYWLAGENDSGCLFFEGGGVGGDFLSIWMHINTL